MLVFGWELRKSSFESGELLRVQMQVGLIGQC